MMAGGSIVLSLVVLSQAAAGPSEQIRTAIADVQATNDYVRQKRGADALGGLGPVAEAGIPALIVLLGQAVPPMGGDNMTPVPGSEEAVAAAGAALEKIGTAAVPALIDALGKPGAAGSRAAGVLGRLQDPRALGPLVAALGVHSFAAQEALVGLKLPGVGEAVAARLVEPAVRRTVIDILVARRDMRVLPALVDDLATSTPYVRRELLGKVAELDPPDGRQYVLRYIDDQDSWVRAYVGVALGTLGNASDVPRLIQMLSAQTSIERWGAAHGLGNLGDARALAPLQAALKKETEGSTRQGITDAIAKIRKEKR